MIVVLALLVVIGLIVASTVAVSQLDDRLTALDRDRAEAAYLAESAVARALWLLRYDCATYPARELGTENTLRSEDTERFVADGTVHVMELPGGRAEVVISDMVSGINLAGTTPDQALKRSAEDAEFAADEGRYERYQHFLSALKDYVDADDMNQLVGGCESADYAVLGRRPLPRNAALQYREEILWIPGAREFFQAGDAGLLDAFVVISPNPRMPQPRGKTSFFSASRDQLVKEGGFTTAEADEIIAARDRWRSEPQRLEDAFAPDLLTRLQQHFSFRESGFYTLTVTARVGAEAAPRVLSCSFQLTGQLAGTETIRYYEWLFLQ